MTLRRLTNPSAEPITVAEVKDRLRITHTDDDAAILAYCQAAREIVEGLTGRRIATATFRCVCGGWGGSAVALGATPLVSIQSVKYWPAEGGSQVTLANYIAITDTEPGQVLWPINLPDVAERPDAITIDFTAGGTPPEDLRQATIMLAAWMYEQPMPVNIGNIVNELPFSLSHILTSHRVGGFIA